MLRMTRERQEVDIDSDCGKLGAASRVEIGPMARYLCDLLCHVEVLTAPFSLHTGTLPSLLAYWGHDRDQ